MKKFVFILSLLVFCSTVHAEKDDRSAKRIESLESSIISLENEIRGLQSSIKSLKSAIWSYESQMSQNEKNIKFVLDDVKNILSNLNSKYYSTNKYNHEYRYHIEFQCYSGLFDSDDLNEIKGIVEEHELNPFFYEYVGTNYGGTIGFFQSIDEANIALRKLPTKYGMKYKIIRIGTR